MEEEKKRFDNRIDSIEKKVTSKFDKDDASSKNNSQKNNYELLE